MVTKLKTRDITRKVERELWARVAGRCELEGCNEPLYISPLTTEPLHIAERAHIYSFSNNGPRGWGPFRTRPKDLNDSSNLMLVCHHCHELIDSNPEKYTAELLIKSKQLHEYRVWTATGISPDKASHVVLYGANIGDEVSPLQPETAKQSMFPYRYPASERAIELGMNWEGKDDSPGYWVAEEANLVAGFNRQIHPIIQENGHISVFALAPIPLLIRLGTLLTDKTGVNVHQLRREPEQSWAWEEEADIIEFTLQDPAKVAGPPALVISLSASIDHRRVQEIVGTDVSIWELTVPEPHNDLLRTRLHLSTFRAVVRRAIAAIVQQHGNSPLMVFPAMPVSTAVEFGRCRSPQVDMPWVIYNQNAKHGSFMKAVTIERQKNGN